ncbi:calcium-binding protein [Belnapia sp. F-4-1]|uniref:calcium-binding protein n=1 Tax=Belnapia sp. F-4-1 TaxID=1545443 RepID=UPI0019171BED|nr:calcium-binding protein [Belnapia sp. F-4-1]
MPDIGGGVIVMADFASIAGGRFDLEQFGNVPNGVDAFYHIETGGLFIDRGLSSGETFVDATEASGGIAFRDGSAGNSLVDGSGNVLGFYGSVHADTVNAGGGDDSISAGNGDNYVSAGDGNDSITAGDNNDTLIGGSGNDLIFGGDGRNNIQGGDGNDTLSAGSGNDSISGGVGNDSLWGGDGNDTLLGGDGMDTLAGGAGNDLLNGGAGPDYFAYEDGFGGNDTILGFSYGEDFVQIKAGMDGVNSLEDLAGKITVEGSSVKISLSSGDTILIKGITGTTAQEMAANPENWIKGLG